MTEPLDELYFTWLYGQVADHTLTDPRMTYWNLFRALYQKEFAWFVPNDDNRAIDGLLMRQSFAEERGLMVTDEYWLRLGCSMLELLIAIARRLQFEGEHTVSFWFWHLIRNIGFLGFYDDRKLPLRRIDSRLDMIIWRTYEDNGGGGLFPLRRPSKDQRKVEIWYQLSAYLLERNE
jgi:hypothetical protein